MSPLSEPCPVIFLLHLFSKNPLVLFLRHGKGVGHKKPASFCIGEMVFNSNTPENLCIIAVLPIPSLTTGPGRSRGQQQNILSEPPPEILQLVAGTISIQILNAHDAFLELRAPSVGFARPKERTHAVPPIPGHHNSLQLPKRKKVPKRCLPKRCLARYSIVTES